MKVLKNFRMCLILCSLTILASCAAQNNGKTTLPEAETSAETTAQDTTAEETTLNEDTAALYSYTLQSSPGYYYGSSVNPATDDNENTIPCSIYTCENADAYVSGSAGSLLLIRDGGWHLFDAVTGAVTDVIFSTDEEIKDVGLAYDIITNGITGYILKNGDNKTAFYSLGTGTIYGGFAYDDMDNRTCGDYFLAYVNTDTDNFGLDSYVLKISDGSVVGSVTSEYLRIIGNNDAVYFISSFNMGCGGDYKLYTSDMKTVSDKHFNMTAILSDGSIMTLGTDGAEIYEIYDCDGNQIYQSRGYDEVLFIWSDGGSSVFAAVVDGGKMMLVDRGGNVLQTYCDWQDSYHFHRTLSGFSGGGNLLSLYQEDYYLGYSVITNPGGEDPVYKNKKLPENKPPALYLTVEDTSDGKARDYFYVPEDGAAGAFDIAYVGGYSKPVLYLYPEKNCDVSVVFGRPEKLTVSYPYYNEGWNVRVMTDGTITDARGREYYALYWEESGFVPTDFSTGFCVKAEDASEFLENKLAQIGLTEREANEFIIYWLPFMQRSGTSLVYFELTASRESYNALQIMPQPDSLLRMAMHIKAVDIPVDVAEQRLPHFERKGFAAVEWGGVIYK